MPVSAESIEATLRENIPITYLEVLDESNGCGENYAVFIVSEAFVGKLPLARHRLINDVLKDQISQMHAFSQKHMTPKQYEAKLAAEAGI